jgi:hypothetical protein
MFITKAHELIVQEVKETGIEYVFAFSVGLEPQDIITRSICAFGIQIRYSKNLSVGINPQHELTDRMRYHHRPLAA